MNKEISISELINQFKESEGESFTINEQAIIAETVELAANRTTVAITVLSILGGVFATLAFLGFLLLAGLYDSEGGLMAFGLLFIIVSVVLNKVYSKTIIDTVSVSAFMIGFCMVGFSLEELGIDDQLLCLIFIGMATGILIINQTYLLSLLSFLLIFGGIFGLLNTNDSLIIFPYIYIAVLALGLSITGLNEVKIISHSQKFLKLYQPLFLATACALIVLLGFSTVVNSYTLEVKANFSWIASIVCIIAVLFTISKIKKRYEHEHTILNNGVIYAGTVLALTPTLFAPAISGGLLLILLSYLINNKVSLVLSIVSFIYFISLYYYNLGYTLLTKSIILFVTGLVFLAAYMLFINKVKSHEEI